MRRVADVKHHRHQYECNREFGDERNGHATRAWQGSGVIHVWMRQRFVNKQRNREHASNAANELRDDIKDCVPILHFSKPPKRQRDSGIKVGPGSFAQRRQNQRDCSPTHRNPREHSANEFAGNDVWNGRSRMPEKYREEPG
jgi:hypothetical protein